MQAKVHVKASHPVILELDESVPMVDKVVVDSGGEREVSNRQSSPSKGLEVNFIFCMKIFMKTMTIFLIIMEY